MATSITALAPAPASLALGTVPEVEGATNPPATQPDTPLWKIDDNEWRKEVLKKVCHPANDLILQKEQVDRSIKQLIEDNYDLLAHGRDHYGKQGQRKKNSIGWQEWIRQNMPCSVRYVNQVMAEIEARLSPATEGQPDDTADDESMARRDQDESVLPDDLPDLANTPDKVYELLQREHILDLEATFKRETPQQTRNAIQTFAQRLCAEFIGDGKALVKIKLVEEEARKRQ